jgi:hypothetical protein
MAFFTASCQIARAADDDAALHVRRDQVGLEILLVAGGGHADRAVRLAADAEDALHEADVRLDDDAFVGDDLDDRSGR